MIVNAVFSWFVGILTWLVGLIPSASALGLPDLSSYGAAIGDSTVWQWWGWANHFLPLDLALTLLGARLAVWLAMYGFEVVSWLLTKAHVLGGSQ